MKDKHFDFSDRVVLNYWSGDISESLRDIIVHNCNYFDKLYLIVTNNDQIFSKLPDNLIIHRTTDDDILNNFFSDKALIDKIKEIGHGAISDILCYFSKWYLNSEMNSNYPKVMYSDTNTIIWNQFLINELFSIDKVGIYLKPSEGFYARYYYENYISSDFSLDLKTPDMNSRWLEVIKDTLLNNPSRYTLLGPSLLQKDYAKPLYKVLPIVPNEVNPGSIYEGFIEVSHKDNSLGLGLSNTLYESAGYTLQTLSLLRENSVKLKFNRICNTK